MIAFQNIDELNKVFRQQLIKQSQLDSEQVLNALSIHGEDLSKLFEENIWVSIERTDALMLFELRSRRNDSDMSQTEQDNSITSYRSFEMYVMIYGKASSDIATNLVARFRTSKVREDLRESGVYLEKVNEPDVLNEYKNETMWLRNDISFEISCKFSIEQVEEIHHFEDAEIKNITI